VDIHQGLKNPGFHPESFLPDQFHQVIEAFRRQSRFFGPVKARPASLFGDPASVNWETARTSPPTSAGKGSSGLLVGEDAEFRRLFGQELEVFRGVSLLHSDKKAYPGPIAPVVRPSTSTRACLTRCKTMIMVLTTSCG